MKDLAYYAHVRDLMRELADPPVGQSRHADQHALDVKSARLMSLAVVVATNHNTYIDRYVQDALTAGASEQEIDETVHLAVRLGGRAGVCCGSEALVVLEGLTGIDICHLN